MGNFWHYSQVWFCGKICKFLVRIPNQKLKKSSCHEKCKLSDTSKILSETVRPICKRSCPNTFYDYDAANVFKYELIQPHHPVWYISHKNDHWSGRGYFARLIHSMMFVSCPTVSQRRFRYLDHFYGMRRCHSISILKNLFRSF